MTVTAFTTPVSLQTGITSPVGNPKGLIAALNDGTYIAFVSGTSSNKSFIFQKYDYAGSNGGQSLIIQAPEVPGYTAGIADLEELTGGGFAVAFSLLNASGRECGATVRFYSSDGTPTSGFIAAAPPQLRSDDPYTGAKTNFDLTGTDNNGVFLRYNDARDFASQDINIRGLFVAANGALGQDVAFGSTQTAAGYGGAAPSTYDSKVGAEKAGDGVHLSNGSVIVPYLDQYNYYTTERTNYGTSTVTKSEYQVSFHIVTPQGNSREVIVALNSANAADDFSGNGIYDIAAPEAVALVGGGFAVAWYEGDGFNSNRQFNGFQINARLFDADGNPTTAVQGIGGYPTINGTYSQPDMQLEALPDGGFVIATNKYTGSYSGSDVTINIVDAFGRTSAAPLTVKGGVDGQGIRDLEVAKDGSILVSTVDGNATLPYEIQRYVVTNGLELVRTGDAGANSLVGGSAADHLDGAGGNDALEGNAGNDVLVGGGGNDTLIGGADADQMFGGTGDDVYSVDNISDIVTESANAGYDTIYTSVTYTLPANVEALIFTGSADVNVTGNEGGNVLIGNAGHNVLTGGGGDDVYGVDGNGDTVVESASGGYDEVYASGNYTMAQNTETLFLTGSAVYATGNNGNNALIGNDLDNVIDAGAGTFEFINGAGGNDILIGGAGHDEINGGAGNDIFRFTAVQDAGDFIYDFTPGQDHIQLNAAAFGIGTAANPLITGVSFIEGSNVTSAVPTLLYTQANGTLFYDVDGTGAQAPVVMAVLNSIPALHATDFTFY